VSSSVLLHEGDESLNTSDGHGIIDGSTETTNATVTSKRNELLLLGLSEEILVIKALRTKEGNIHTRAVLRDNRVGVVGRGVNVFIEKTSLLCIESLDGLDTTLLKDPLKDKTSDVDVIGSRSVVHGASISLSLVHHDGWATIKRLALNEILTDDHDGETSRTVVLLGTGVDDTKLADIKLLAEEVRRHISNKRNVSRDLRGLVEFDTLDGLIITIVDVGSLRVEWLPGGSSQQHDP